MSRAGVVMKKCPFCLGEIPDAAAKCQHCGEWVNRPSPAADEDQSLGRAANRYVSFKMVMGVLAFIIALIFFFLVWLPGWNRAHRNFNSFPSLQIHATEK